MLRIKTYRLPYPGLLVLVYIISFVLHSCSNAQVPAATLTFPAGRDSIEIPFERDRGWIVIKVRVNNSRELSFILDTGAPIAVLVNDKLADQLDLQMQGSVSVKGTDSNAPRSVPLATNIKFNIAGIEITGGLMAIGATTAAVSGVDGIIGKYLFADAIVRIDWKRSRLVVSKPEKFSYQGTGQVLQVTPAAGGHFYTEVTVEFSGHKMATKADIDIGNSSSYLWVNKNKDYVIPETLPVLSNIIAGWGANGPYYGDVFRSGLTIGSMLLDSVVTVFKDGAANEQINANIGISLLERFNPIFDYPHHQLILEKNEHFPAPFTFNQSGIIASPLIQKDYITIAEIIPRSPASEQGLVAGDRIFSINGIKISLLEPSKIKELIQGRNSVDIELEIKKGERLISVHLKMRKLI